MTDIAVRLRGIASYCRNEDVSVVMGAASEIDRLRAALKRIANDDVDEDIRGRADILSGIAWAALEGIYRD